MGKGIDTLNLLFDKYKIDQEDRITIKKIIHDILIHDEFQKRFEKGFYHHGSTMLGEHILEDTIVTYILCKKRKKPIDIEIALKIAMMHDLYTRPWQNSGVKKQFFNRHGFSHPIEAVINSSDWFKDEFDSFKTKILIDGIVHHMYPLPVTSYQDYDYNKLELYNYDLSKTMPENVKIKLINSSNRNRIGRVSLASSKYTEGRLMSFADKIVSANQIDNLDSVVSLVTGNNKTLIK